MLPILYKLFNICFIIDPQLGYSQLNTILRTHSILICTYTERQGKPEQRGCSLPEV